MIYSKQTQKAAEEAHPGDPFAQEQFKKERAAANRARMEAEDAEQRRAERAERKAAQAAQPQAAPAKAAPAPKPAAAAAPAPAPVTSTTGAAPQMQAYDQYAQAALGQSPQEAMQQAQAAAAQQAAAQSDAAIRQAVKGARTAGAMPGQAALATGGIAADAYGAGQQAAQQQYFDLTKFGATLGSEMSSRLARGEQTQAGLDMAKMQADAARDAAKRQQRSSMLGNVIGAVGGIASLFSDEELKEDIEPGDMTEGLDKIGGYSYKYKGAPREEAGVMAQDLERTPMAPAVVDTPKGKMVDTRRLTTMNTAALSEHEKRLKDIERLVQSLGNIPAPRKV